MADNSTGDMSKALGAEKKHIDTPKVKRRPLSANINGRGGRAHVRQTSTADFSSVLAALKEVETEGDKAAKASSAAGHVATPGKK